MYEKYFKRMLDVILSLLGLVIISPVLFIVAVLIHFKLGSPIIFKQDRPGLNEKIFRMYKFRTMTDERDENGELLPNEIRLTRLGKILRSTSLDELPELFNILKGDMSFVGPRPLLVQYLPLYNSEQKRRHEVRPGLTGLAQVNGRNSINWEERFLLDIQYVNNVRFMGDLRIMLQTVIKVLRKEGINPNHAAFIEPFQGIKKD